MVFNISCVFVGARLMGEKKVCIFADVKRLPPKSCVSVSKADFTAFFRDSGLSQWRAEHLYKQLGLPPLYKELNIVEGAILKVLTHHTVLQQLRRRLGWAETSLPPVYLADQIWLMIAICVA